MNYSIYSESTGEVLRCVICPQDQLEWQLQPGERHVQGDYLQGFRIDLQSRLPVPLPSRPSEFHVFDYTTLTWLARPDAAWRSVRLQRDALLGDSDWRVTKALESGVSMSPDWVAYRQALRDITLQSDPFNITWPLAPA